MHEDCHRDNCEI